MGCLRAPWLMEVGAWTESITSENTSTKPWSRRIQLAFPIAIKLLESEMNTETNYIYSCLANLITHFSQIKCIFRVYKEATIAKFVLQKQLKVNKSKTTRTFSNKTIAKIGKKNFKFKKIKKQTIIYLSVATHFMISLLFIPTHVRIKSTFLCSIDGPGRRGSHVIPAVKRSPRSNLLNINNNNNK